MLLSTTTF